MQSIMVLHDYSKYDRKIRSGFKCSLSSCTLIPHHFKQYPSCSVFWFCSILVLQYSTLKYSPHPISSDSSLQSGMELHLRLMSMHEPSYTHWNSKGPQRGDGGTGDTLPAEVTLVTHFGDILVTYFGDTFW